MDTGYTQANPRPIGAPVKPDQLLFTFCCIAEAVADSPADVLSDMLEVAKHVAVTEPHTRDGAKFTEPLIIAFLEKALAKRRLME